MGCIFYFWSEEGLAGKQFYVLGCITQMTFQEAGSFTSDFTTDEVALVTSAHHDRSMRWVFI